MKQIVFPLVVIISLFLPSCSKTDEATIIPDCDTLLCARSFRPNGDFVRDYECNLLKVYNVSDGYFVFSVEENRARQPGLFLLRVGSPSRPIFDGPGTYRIQDTDATYLSYEYVDTIVQSFIGYGGYITVESASETELSGFFEVDTKNKNQEVYQKINGRFQYSVD